LLRISDQSQMPQAAFGRTLVRVCLLRGAGDIIRNLIVRYHRKNLLVIATL
jgi:hypothetical protein